MQKYFFFGIKSAITTVFLVFVCNLSFSQSLQIGKVQVGGNFGFDITNNILVIDIAPVLGTSPIKNTTLSVSPFFSYAQDLSQPNNRLTRCGLRAAVQYSIYAGLFAHAEYELSFVYLNRQFQGVYHALPIGLGFEQLIAPNTVAYAAVLYNVIHSQSDFVQSPFQYRVGVRHAF
ncbi:MAG: hypothetical protein LBU90_10680 [Bacteroidales bacterium]|jgi:hypothetical protein|nr:hypothetical protein [Bacteroidales bacterium]